MKINTKSNSITTRGIVLPKFRGLFSEILNNPKYWRTKYPDLMKTNNQEIFNKAVKKMFKYENKNL